MTRNTVILLALISSFAVPAYATPVKPDPKRQVVRAAYPAATPATVAIWLFGSA
jgi:hypothetical protein